MIKVQKSKLIKIIRYDDDDDDDAATTTDRQINLLSNTHGFELIINDIVPRFILENVIP